MQRNLAKAAGPAIVLLLAGCTDTDGVDSGLQGPLSQEDGILLSGFVADDVLLPVEGAFVSVEGFETVVESDVEGRFLLGPFQPGEYTLHAEKAGYTPTTQQVRLAWDDVPSPLLILEASATTVPYHETQHHVTFVQCASRNLIGGVPCTKLVDYVLGTNISSEEKFSYIFQIPDPASSTCWSRWSGTPRRTAGTCSTTSRRRRTSP